MKKTCHALVLTVLMLTGPSYSWASPVEAPKRVLSTGGQGYGKKTQGGITESTPPQDEKLRSKEIRTWPSVMDCAKGAARVIYSPIQWVFASNDWRRNIVATFPPIFLAMSIPGFGHALFNSDPVPYSKWLFPLQSLTLAIAAFDIVDYMDAFHRPQHLFNCIAERIVYVGPMRDGLFLSDLNPETVHALEESILELKSKTGDIGEDDKKRMASYLKNWLSISDTVYKALIATLIKKREKLPGLHTQYSQCHNAIYPKNQEIDGCLNFKMDPDSDRRSCNLRHLNELDNRINWLETQHETLRFTFEFIMGRIDQFVNQPSLVSKWGLKEFKKTYDLASRKMRSQLVAKGDNAYAVGDKVQATWCDLICSLKKEGFIQRRLTKEPF